MTINDLEAKLDKLSDLLGDLTIKTHNLKEVSEVRREIFDHFKEIEFPDVAVRQQLWDSFQMLNDVWKGKQNIINNDNKKFADEAIELINQTENEVNTILQLPELGKNEFGNIRAIINNTFEIIKQNKWPSRELRNEHWDRFNLVREAVRKIEDNYYTQLREEIQNRTAHSGDLTKVIIEIVENTHPDKQLAELVMPVRNLKQFFLEPDEELKDVALLQQEIDPESKSTLRIKSDVLRDIRKIITESRNEITKDDKQRIYVTIDSFHSLLDNAWKSYKEEMQLKQSTREERIKQNAGKKQEWLEKQKDFLTMLEGRFENQTAFREKLKKIAEDQDAFIARLESRIENQQDYLIKLNDQLIDLEEQQASAWTEKFKEKVDGWIVNKKQKMGEVEKEVLNLHKKIAEIKRKTDDIPGRIEEITASIAEISEKIIEVKDKLKKRNNDTEDIKDAEAVTPEMTNDEENITVDTATSATEITVVETALELTGDTLPEPTNELLITDEYATEVAPPAPEVINSTDIPDDTTAVDNADAALQDNK